MTKESAIMKKMVFLAVVLAVVMMNPANSPGGENRRAWLNITSVEIDMRDTGSLDGTSLKGGSQSALGREGVSPWSRKMSINAEYLGTVRGYHLTFTVPPGIRKSVSWECGAIFSDPLVIDKFDQDKGLYHVGVVIKGKGAVSEARKAHLGDLIIHGAAGARADDIACVYYEFLDRERDVDIFENGEWREAKATDLAIQDIDVENPAEEEEFEGLTVFPNPFNAITTIQFNLEHGGKTRIAIFNIEGKLVRSLIDEVLPAGVHAVRWNGKNSTAADAASGIYFCNFKTPEMERTFKIILLR